MDREKKKCGRAAKRFRQRGLSREKKGGERERRVQYKQCEQNEE